jgi:hypothetical protein
VTRRISLPSPDTVSTGRKPGANRQQNLIQLADAAWELDERATKKPELAENGWVYKGAHPGDQNGNPGQFVRWREAVAVSADHDARAIP